MIHINARIVEAARSFINTPFHLQGRKKSVGIDCLGLIVEVANMLKLNSRKGEPLKSYDINNYTLSDHNLLLINELDQHLFTAQHLHIGTIALFKNHDNYHLAFIGDYKYGGFSLIHSCMKAEKVVEHRLTKELKEKILRIYTMVDK